MKLVWFFLLFYLPQFMAVGTGISVGCEQGFVVFEEMDSQRVEGAYSFYRQNSGQWHQAGVAHGISFVFEPKEIATYSFSWTVKDPKGQFEGLANGTLQCEFPTSWQLILSPSLSIVYPSVAHGQKQEQMFHKAETVAGIYLGKSKYAFHPDLIRLMWHFSSKNISATDVSGILANYNFVGDKVFVMADAFAFDKTEHVQLVGFALSNHESIEEGSQQWLVTNAADHMAIREGKYATEHSRRDGWLPWLTQDFEFGSGTLQEAYQSTAVVPIEQASVYDRRLRRWVPEPISLQVKSQAIFDLLSAHIDKFQNSAARLFAHLVLKQPSAYFRATFEIFLNGQIDLKSIFALNDPIDIGLPSAKELGFAPFEFNH